MVALNGGRMRIKNLGTQSTQGDIFFASKLQELGITSIISENEIYIERDPKKPMKNIEINMIDVTDTFITMAVILSTVPGVSQIRGIANQKLKECNRIHAVTKNLNKCGILARELPDGVEIYGKDIPTNQVIPKFRKKVLIKT